MYCTEAESSFRPSSRFCDKNRLSCHGLDLFGSAISCDTSCGEALSDHSPSSSKGSRSQCCRHDAIPFPDFQSWKKPAKADRRLMQEEDLIGRLDECISDANSHSSAVDCTLSLGTPATRYSTTGPATFVTTEPALNMATTPACDHPPLHWFKGSSESILHQWLTSSSSPSPSNNISCLPLDSRGSFVSAKETLRRNYMSFFKQQRLTHKSGSRVSEIAGSAGRKCANCDTATTPLWRNGPKGPKSLCNACGIRYKKEERRTATVIAASDQYYQTKRSRNNEDRDLTFEKGNNCNDISRESSCLSWQGSLSAPSNNIMIQLQRPKSTVLESSILNGRYTHNDDRIPRSNSAEGNGNNSGLEQKEEDGGPTLLLGLSMNGPFGSQKQ